MGQPMIMPEDRESLFPYATDPSVMLEVFQKYLPAWTAVPVKITGCKVRLIKFRSGGKPRKLKSIYRITLESDAGQRWERSVLGTLPVTPAFLDGAFSQLCRSAVGHPLLVPFSQPGGFIPELHLGLQVFPLDLALPVLVEATRPDNAHLVTPHVPECRQGWVVQHSQSKHLHYKPENRCVIAWKQQLKHPQTGRTTDSVVYAKFFADDRGEEIYQNMEALWKVACRSVSLRVPQPLGYDPSRRMLVMSEAPGERDLTEWVKCLEKQRPLPPGVDLARLERCMTVVADALTELHGCGLQLSETRSFDAELEEQRQDLELVRRKHPAFAEHVDRVLLQMASCARDDGPLVSSHGGFRHKQMMGNDHGLTLLDFDGLCLAHPALDAGSFISRLRREPVIHPGQARELERLAGLFRHEFLRRQPAVTRSQLALYESLALTERAVRSFRKNGSTDVLRRGECLMTAAQQLLDNG